MKEYYWGAKLIKNGEPAGGCIFARDKADAIMQLESYGYYADIQLEEVR